MLLQSRCLLATAARASLVCRRSLTTRARSHSPGLYRKNLIRHSESQWRDIARTFSASNILSSLDAERSSSHVLDGFKKHLSFPAATRTLKDLAENGHELSDEQVTLHGYLGTRRDAGKHLTFAELYGIDLKRRIQLVSTPVKGVAGADTPHQRLRTFEEHTPVAVDGTVKVREAPRAGSAPDVADTVIANVEVKVENIVALNGFPQDIIIKEDTVFGPEQRHLQIRNDSKLRDSLAFRSKAAHIIRDELCNKEGFTEIETPLLFKSTPEGAREFLVPTRSPGLAYALPQSPQQYKQILMASGIPRYMQIAKCFRDEDLRADRQPEFTQVDLEMAFASSEDVINTTESVIKRLWKDCLDIQDLPSPFLRMTYEDAMSKFGSDKPDLRFGSQIRRIEYMLPVDLIQKIGPHSDPMVEVMKVQISGDPRETREFVSSFMDSPAALPFHQNPDGQPGIFIYGFTQATPGTASLWF